MFVSLFSSKIGKLFKVSNFAVAMFFVAVFCIASFSATPSFITNRSFPSGSNNRGAAVADFNNDGKLDIVTINAASPTYQAAVMFGNGDGTFGNPIMTNTEQNANAVAVGDFNNDNKQDIAYTVSGARSVAIQRGNGNGTFALPDIFLVAHSTPSDIVAKDFNNDNKLDVAVANGTVTGGELAQKLSVLFGDGLGGLGAATDYIGDASNSGSASLVASADSDGDGDNDIIMTAESGNVRRWLNNGNGTFTFSNIIATPYNHSIAAFGNFNQDNIADIVTSNFGYPGQNLPRVLFSLSGTPAMPQRQVARESGERAEVNRMITADLDGDGRNDDVAFTRPISRSVTVMLNASEPNGEITSYFGGSSPNIPMVGDFNNDGRIDLAVSQTDGNQIWILLNAGNGKFNAPLRPTTQNNTDRDIKVGNFNGDAYPDIAMSTDENGGGLQTFNGLSGGGFGNMSVSPTAQLTGSRTVAVGDLNNDGKEDIVITYGTGLAPFLGNGDGTFNFVNATFGNSIFLGVVLGDYNADNKLDAVVADAPNDRIGYFRGNGQGAFNSAVFFNVGNSPVGVVTQDFNGDGKLDIATANRNSNNVSVLLGVGDGTFSAVTNFNVGTAPEWLALGDFNGDSKTDIAVTNLNSNNVSILLGNGMGGFSNATNFPANATPSQLTAGDLNGDGFLDIAVVGYQNQTVSILTGNGDGTFNAPTTIADFFNLPVAIKAMDVNADNRLDLVVTNQQASSITVLINNTQRRTAFDFDGDGKSDISVYRPSNGIWYLLNSNTGFTATQFGISSDRIAPADFDGDGRTDLAVYRDGTWFIQRSTLGFTSIQFGITEDIPQPADFDGDGRAEIAVYRPSNGTWYIFNLTNSQFNGFQFGISEDKPVVGDYDGDNRADYAVFRPSNGIWYYQQSTNGFAGIQFGLNTDRPVPADYDGDGRTDVAVYRPSNGIWYYQRSTAGFGAIQFGLDTDKPSPADYDGDGRADVAVYRPSNGIWYLQQSTLGFTGIQFGIAEDKPIPNAFVP